MNYQKIYDQIISKRQTTEILFKGKRKEENWQQGIALIDYEEGNGLFNINPIAISDGRMIYNNNIYIGNDDYVESLMKDTGGKF